MLKGILFAIFACWVWGGIYVVPQLMPGFSSIEIAMGRYAIFGFVSCLIFFHMKRGGKFEYPLFFWGKALYFSLISTFLYYILLVLSVRYSSPAVSALILGTSPITIALYGNWKQKEIPFRKLILPSLLILVGLAFINLPHLLNEPKLGSYLLGLSCALFSLAAWTWYVVTNARFLKQNPFLHPSHWCTMIGMGAFFWVFVLGAIAFFFLPGPIDWGRYLFLQDEGLHFLLGSLVLGLFCSWLAEFLWNQASFRLPVSLAGQLTLLESAFAVLFVFLLEQRWPPWLEATGILIQLTAVLYGIHQFSKSEKKASTSLQAS